VTIARRTKPDTNASVYVSVTGAELRVARAVLMIFLSRAVVVAVGGSRSNVAPPR
jgi:hypothetical protein